MATIAEIWRFPVKGLGGEQIPVAELTQSGGLAHDRRFAFAHGESRYDPSNPTWCPKREFLQMAKDDGITPIHARWDEANNLLTLTADFGRGPSVTAAPSDPAGRKLLAEFLERHSGERRRPGQTLVTANGIVFSDLGLPIVSLISRATVNAIADVAGYPLDPIRFRGNFVLDGLNAWDEMSWIGHNIQLGGVRLHVFEPIGRCYATTLNPETGESDTPIPNLLVKNFGHNKCGVYAEIMTDGTVAVGETVSRFAGLLGRAGAGMSTEEIMELTRGDGHT